MQVNNGSCVISGLVFEPHPSLKSIRCDTPTEATFQLRCKFSLGGSEESLALKLKEDDRSDGWNDQLKVNVLPGAPNILSRGSKKDLQARYDRRMTLPVCHPPMRFTMLAMPS